MKVNIKQSDADPLLKMRGIASQIYSFLHKADVMATWGASSEYPQCMFSRKLKKKSFCWKKCFILSYKMVMLVLISLFVHERGLASLCRPGAYLRIFCIYNIQFDVICG